MAMQFLNKLFVKAIFSEASELNVTAYDMGEAMLSMSFTDEVVTRLRTATGTVGSLAIFVSAEINISINKTSSLIDTYYNRILSNAYIGGSLTIYDDTNTAWSMKDVSITVRELPAMNGTEAATTFIAHGNLEVNKDVLLSVGL